MKQSEYRDGPLIVISITSGEQTTVHHLGRGVGQSIDRLTKHISVLEGKVLPEGKRERAYAQAVDAANKSKLKAPAEHKAKVFPHFALARGMKC